MMQPHLYFYPKTILVTGFAFGLAACGGSSESAAENQAPIAADVKVEFDRSQDFPLIDVLASATDADGDALSISSVGDAEFGTTSIEDNQISYQPEEGFFGVDTFSYTISDGVLEDSAEVEVEVFGTVSFQGRVIDSPIANARVTITIDGIAYTVDADDEGIYELPATIRSLEADDIIRITARGSEANNQGHVTLSSMLVSAGKILERAGADFALSREELNEVNVTHVTTARDILIRRAAGDEAVTERNVTEYGNTIDPQLLIQMAAVTKLIIDDADFDLPTGYESIEDFLNDDTGYNGFVEEASKGGAESPLNKAIEETLNDPEIMPQLRVEDLYGRFVQVKRAPWFLKPDADRTWHISEDGLTWFGDMADYAGRLTFSLSGNRLVADQKNMPLARRVFLTSFSESSLDGRPEVRDAWMAYTELQQLPLWQVERVSTSGINNARVVSHSESELVLRYQEFYRIEAYTFEYEGTEYELLPATLSEVDQDARLVAVDEFKQSDLIFDLEAQSTWLLPYPQYLTPSLLETSVIDFAPDNTYTIRQADLIDQYFDTVDFSSEGVWALSADKRTLTLTTKDGQDAIRLTRHRDQPDYQSVLTEYLIDGEPRTVQLRYGLPFPESIDFSPIENVTSSSLLFNSIVNYRAAVYWGSDDKLRIQSFMFDFTADQRGEQLAGLCEGEPLGSRMVCGEVMTLSPDKTGMSWRYTQTDEFEEVFEFNRLADSATNDSLRYWIPLAFSERNIMSVLEWNIFLYKGAVQPGVFYLPRFNHYQLTERPAEGSQSQMSGFRAMNTGDDAQSAYNHGYMIVNPQQGSPARELN